MRPLGSKGSILVFLGPSVKRQEAEAVLDAVFLPPASQGDILLAAHAFRPRAMVLIDGQFEDRPSVRHQEILWALANGIVMIGAASIGALRAAELYPFGMTGVGVIYRWYRRWPLAPDDAVAIQSAPRELGFVPLTDAMVDLHATFSLMARTKSISQLERDRLTDIARSMNFRDRSLRTVLAKAGWQGHRIEQAASQIFRLKREDALQALSSAPQFLLEGIKPRFPWSWTKTDTFLRDLDSSRIDIDLLDTYS
jgi:hypothetical protein